MLVRGCVKNHFVPILPATLRKALPRHREELEGSPSWSLGSHREERNQERAEQDASNQCAAYQRRQRRDEKGRKAEHRNT